MSEKITEKGGHSMTRTILDYVTKLSLAGTLIAGALAGGATALAGGPDAGDGDLLNLLEHQGSLVRPDPSAPLIEHDATTGNIISSGPFGKVIKNLATSGRGERLVGDATTDVWALGKFAYTGTFNSPCGGDPEAGVWIWDVHNHNKVEFVGIIPSPTGSRANDVKAASMNSGDILVHSNESCGGGPGGFEIYNVDDPTNPLFLASVRIDELNPISDFLFGGISDVGVHNLWLFTQGGNDYVAAVAGTAFDNFMIFDITDPTTPTMVGAWGAEEVFDPGVGDLTDIGNTEHFSRVLDAALWLLDGFGSSANRFLHDITGTADGNKMYLSNWDAGLILLDISDVANPQLVSVALDPANGSLDGEVNSHAAWPSEDGNVVVETEEDFDAWEASAPPGNLTFGELTTNVIPGTAISTTAGDAFEANQTGNSGTVDGSSVTVTSGPLAGQVFAAIELAGNQPKFSDTGPISGNLVWIGRACAGDPLVNPLSSGDIAVVRRGTCFFSEKLNTAATNGASAIVISNNLTSTPWSGVRIWDYSDPANPVLASTFNTVCSASTAPAGDCDPAGTYSVHNVQVETTGNKTKAYISWYWDGMLILDVTDPYNPIETARFFNNTPEFVDANGGNPHDFWGVYKQSNAPWIYGSDRNGGLHVFKEYGSGSAKVAKR
jgi:hypothetical protein